jgi:hypothetical protein
MMKIEDTILSDIIDQEVEWCRKNKNNYALAADYKKGFIAGLKQAKYLLLTAMRVMKK